MNANTSLIALDEGIGGGPKARRFFVTRRRATRASNPLEERIITLIEPTATDLGYRLVRVRVSGNRRKRLQIMAERIADGDMNVDDCGRLSRAVSSALDLDDPIPDEYDLEVSSPGIDRPLMRVEDFARFVGHEAKVEAAALIEGRKRFKGVIAGVDGEEIRLTMPEGDEVRFKIAALSDARLVLTDRLIQEDLKRAKAAAEAANEQ
ncbi:ribosome maturation factor RimP [Terricaulis sp.]|uniref:ribosome maturation factor RimP n=1 Tax=Terricaulis sp. TaxID=2768686 RepID=UPI003784C6F8